MSDKPKIYISHISRDKPAVKKLYNELMHAGFEPWMDEMNLLPGQDWDAEIRKAIRDSDFILICLSKNALDQRGYIQREIKYALDLGDERVDGDIYIIPVRLEETEVPERLAHLQWVNLYEPDGFIRLVSAIKAGIKRRETKTEQIESLYNFPNIRSLLVDEFTTEELRQLVYDLPELRPLYRQIGVGTSKRELVSKLMDVVHQRFQLETLLKWIKVNKPTEYIAHLPYYNYIENDPFINEEDLNKPLDNPYVVGNPIQPSNMKVFLGRFDVARTIVSEIKKNSQKPSILLYGRRRMGKTSALLNISELIRDPSFITIYISGQSAKFHTNVNFCYYLVQAVNERLQENSIDTIVFQQKGYLSKTSFEQHPVLTLSEFFDECEKLLKARRLYCLLCIDEYEEIDSHINTGPGNLHQQSLTRELLLELRDTLQHKPRFTFLFAGTHFLRDLSNVDWSSIFINVKTLHISFLEKRDSLLLLTQPVPEMKYDPQDLLDQIMHLTGCQPFLLQAVASEVVNTLNFRGTRTVTQEVLNTAIDEVLVKHNTYFDYLWDKECTSTQRVLLKTVMAMGGGVPEAKLQHDEDSLRDLIRKEILKNDKGTIKATMPILKLWMKKHQYILSD